MTDKPRAFRVDNPQALGQALTAARESAGATKASVGEAIGTTGQRIGAYERAELAPNTLTLLRVLNALGWELALAPKERP
jgi:hypothetical protein